MIFADTPYGFVPLPGEMGIARPNMFSRASWGGGAGGEGMSAIAANQFLARTGDTALDVSRQPWQNGLRGFNGAPIERPAGGQFEKWLPWILLALAALWILLKSREENEHERELVE